MISDRILTDFDQFLVARGLRLEGIVIGGAALLFLGVVSRATKDIDVLSPLLTQEQIQAAQDFALHLRQQGEILSDDWLNNGPSTLAQQLPPDWEQRTTPLFKGRAISFSTLGRSDFLLSKLFALCDRAIDIDDCLALKPKQQELLSSLEWLAQQDAHPDWPKHVKLTLADLAKRLGYGLP